MTSAHSGMIIEAVDEGHCVARINITNKQTDYMPQSSGALEVNGIVVQVSYALNVDLLGAERYSFIPPDGYIAMPPDIIVNDDDYGTVMICQWVGG